MIQKLNKNNFPLPVSLNSFQGKSINENVILTWYTSSENDLEEFKIQRSKDGVKWKTIESVYANNTAAVYENQYSFFDKTSLKGLQYYRLKIIDAEGEIEFSHIISVRNEKESEILSKGGSEMLSEGGSEMLNEKESEILLIPNRTSNTFSIVGIEEAEVIIYNNLGEIVRGFHFVRGFHLSNQEIDIKNFQPGKYIVKIIVTDTVYIRSITKI